MSAPAVHLGRIALRGGLVTGAAQAVKMVVQFLSVIILARLLAPEDFGLIASVGPIVAFVGLFQNLGLQQAVIQRKDITQKQLNQVFWVTMLVGLASTAIVIALSPAVAVFYGDPRLTGVTIAAGLPLMLGSLSALPLSLMSRNLQFGQLAINDVLVAIASLAAAAGSAYAGLGYWSLLVGSAAAALVSVLAAWRVARWTPGPPTWRIDRDILSFGANLTGFNFANFFSRNLDNILIGRFSGAVALGYYDRAYKLLLFPLQNINAPLSRVMIPLLSKVEQDKARFRDLYLRTLALVMFATVPGIAALTIVAPEAVRVLFGPRWLPVAPIFSWLGLAGMVQPLNNTTGWIFICQGRMRTMFRWGLFGSLSTIAAFLAGLPWGAVGVAAAYALTDVLVRLPILWIIIGRVGPVRVADYAVLQLPLFGAAAATFLVMRLPAFEALADWPRILSAVAASYLFSWLAGALTRRGRATFGEAYAIARNVAGGLHAAS